jgi:hypothetical protein
MKFINIKYDPISRKFSKKPEEIVMAKFRKLNQFVRDFDPIIKLLLKILSFVVVLLGIYCQI